MKTLAQLSKGDLLMALFSANDRFLDSLKKPGCSLKEKQGARLYLSAIVEEISRRTAFGPSA